MTQYCNLNVKLSNSKLNKLKLGIKNGNFWNLHQMRLVILMIQIIFFRKLLLTNKQVSKLHKAFANDSLANMKLSKLNCLKQDNQDDF